VCALHTLLSRPPAVVFSGSVVSIAAIACGVHPRAVSDAPARRGQVLRVNDNRLLDAGARAIASVLKQVCAAPERAPHAEG
jgi:hypothetical protein